MFYRSDSAGLVNFDLGVPPLTVVLRHARDGEPELTTQVDTALAGSLSIPNLGEVSFQLEVRRVISALWWVLLRAEFGGGRVSKDFPIHPLEEDQRGVALRARPRGVAPPSVEAFLFQAFSELDEYLNDEYHGHPA